LGRKLKKITKKYIKSLGINKTITDEKLIVRFREIFKSLLEKEKEFKFLEPLCYQFDEIEIDKRIDTENFIHLKLIKNGGGFSSIRMYFDYLNEYNSEEIKKSHIHVCEKRLIKIYQEREKELKEFKKRIFEKN